MLHTTSGIPALSGDGVGLVMLQEQYEGKY